MRVAARQAAEIENDAVHAFRRGIAFHMGVAVEVNLGVLSLPREQFICLADSILLHIECEDAAAFPRKLAEQRRVAAPAGCCIDAERARLYRAAKKIVHNG